MPRIRAVVDAYLSATLPGHAPHPAMIPMAGIAAADYAASAHFQADDGPVGADAAGRVQEMGGYTPLPGGGVRPQFRCLNRVGITRDESRDQHETTKVREMGFRFHVIRRIGDKCGVVQKFSRRSA